MLKNHSKCNATNVFVFLLFHTLSSVWDCSWRWSSERHRGLIRTDVSLQSSESRRIRQVQTPTTPTSYCGWKTVSRVLLIKSTFCLSCPPLSSKCATPIVPSGADFFGFSHPTIQNLIQSCPGARKCTKYVKQNRENADAFNIWGFRNYLCFRMFIFFIF